MRGSLLKYLDMLFSCVTCSRPFASSLALRGHTRVHADTYEDATRRMAQTNEERAKTRYNGSPRRCGNCQVHISYETYSGNHYVKYCSKSCAAVVTNAAKGPRSSETRDAIRPALKGRYAALHTSKARAQESVPIVAAPREHSSAWRFRNSVVGPYSRLICCTCATCNKRFIAKVFAKYCPDHQADYKHIRSVHKTLAATAAGPFSRMGAYICQHCDIEFISHRRQKYCSHHVDSYGDVGRNRFEFTFNPFAFPDLFSKNELALVVERGFWSPLNTGGMTKDHRVSVNTAIRNGHLPHYIKHPLNCKLMGWVENNRKKTKSSMLYAELVRLVDEYVSAVPLVSAQPS